MLRTLGLDTPITMFILDNGAPQVSSNRSLCSVSVVSCRASSNHPFNEVPLLFPRLCFRLFYKDYEEIAQEIITPESQMELWMV